MKKIWLAVDEPVKWKKIKPHVTTALEAGITTFLTTEANAEKISELGEVTLALSRDSPLTDILVVAPEKVKPSKKPLATEITIQDKSDEEKAIELAKTGVRYLVASTTDWKVIPVENLIAELQSLDTELLIKTDSLSDAKIALETLEIGVDGIVLKPTKTEDITELVQFIQETSREKLSLTPVKITNLKPAGTGSRACIDTCSVLRIGEGMLVGSQSNGLFLIHSETVASPYVEARPFRVNAGPVHAYIQVPGGKTKYLSELAGGDEVLIVDKDGNTKTAVVGRVKIEERPLLLIEAEHKGQRFKTLVQNAETIRLVDADGNPISIAKLKVGDKVLAYLSVGGRHFGTAVTETIIER